VADWGDGSYELTAAQLAPVADVVVDAAEPVSGLKTLDLACGTGKIGVDLSENMLVRARINLTDYPDALLLHQDMRELDLNDTVDAVVCALDGFNHLSDSASLCLAFQRAALFLNRNGLLIFDLISEEKFFHVLPENVSVFDMDKVFCVWQSELSGKRSILHNLNYFKPAGDNRYLRSDECFREYWFSPKTVESALKKAGMTLVEVNCEDPMRTFYIARKGDK